MIRNLRGNYRLLLWALAASLIPPITFLVASFFHDMASTNASLRASVTQGARRIDILLNSAERVLRDVEQDINPDDPTALVKLQRIVYDNPQFREVGIINSVGFLTLSSLGKVNPPVFIQPEHRSDPQNRSLQIIGPKKTVLASEDSIILSLPTVGQGEVNLLVHPLILTTEWGLLRPPDLGPDGFLAYVNTANGEILASSGEVPSYEILQQSATAGQIRVAQASQNGDVLVIGEVPSSWALRNWKHELLLMVPITILSSGALMALALRLLQRSQGLDHDLSIGFKNEELVIHYQPINDLQTGDCVGCEALLRWYHPEQGVLPPGLFIPIAEKTGLINEIGEWLIKKIVMEKASLYERFPKLYTSINVSPNQLSSGSLDRIISWLLETDLCRPDRFVFEVTETIQVLKSGTNTSDTLARLRTLGARIALDDFGQGYSSLSYLHQFDIDQLKIDRFYVDSIHKDNQVTEIMETIIELGHRLGFTFVAEGIETEEQHQFLRDRGVQYGQGWLFSRPLPIRELEQYFIEHRPPEET